MTEGRRMKRVLIEILKKQPSTGIWWQPWSDKELYVLAKEISSTATIVEVK